MKIKNTILTLSLSCMAALPTLAHTPAPESLQSRVEVLERENATLRQRLAGVEAYMQKGLAPLERCAADTAPLHGRNTEAMLGAVKEYRSVAPVLGQMKLIDTRSMDATARRVEEMAAQAAKMQAAAALPGRPYSPGAATQTIDWLKGVADSRQYCGADRRWAAALASTLDQDLRIRKGLVQFIGYIAKNYDGIPTGSDGKRVAELVNSSFLKQMKDNSLTLDQSMSKVQKVISDLQTWPVHRWENLRTAAMLKAWCETQQAQLLTP